MNIERIPLSYRGKTIMTYRCGTGNDVVVLLHGSGCDHALLSWDGVLERLGKRTRVYAIDLPGYGESDPLEEIPEEGFYPYYHHCLEAIVDQLKLDRFVLVGLSMGGAISIRYALAHPEQVCGLVPVRKSRPPRSVLLAHPSPRFRPQHLPQAGTVPCHDQILCTERALRPQKYLLSGAGCSAAGAFKQGFRAGFH